MKRNIFLTIIELIANCSSIQLFIFRKQRPEDEIQYFISDKKEKRTTKAHVNSLFFKQLRALLSKQLQSLLDYCGKFYISCSTLSFQLIKLRNVHKIRNAKKTTPQFFSRFKNVYCYVFLSFSRTITQFMDAMGLYAPSSRFQITQSDRRTCTELVYNQFPVVCIVRKTCHCNYAYTKVKMLSDAIHIP